MFGWIAAMALALAHPDIPWAAMIRATSTSPEALEIRPIARWCAVAQEFEVCLYNRHILVVRNWRQAARWHMRSTGPWRNCSDVFSAGSDTTIFTSSTPPSASARAARWKQWSADAAAIYGPAVGRRMIDDMLVAAGSYLNYRRVPLPGRV